MFCLQSAMSCLESVYHKKLSAGLFLGACDLDPYLELKRTGLVSEQIELINKVSGRL